MLFNSYEFILVFLPLVLIIYFFKKKNNNLSIFFLVIFSLFFYAYHKFIFIFLITASILTNFLLASLIINYQKESRRWFYFVGIIFNLGLLTYFKYTNFLIFNINSAFKVNIEKQDIFLPLAISFFTFQQIAFLSDTMKNKVQNLTIAKYILFISFFPQLIAGPIVRYYDIIPQFLKKKSHIFRHSNFFLGFSLFTLGLSKKVLIADNLGPFVDLVFSSSLENNYIHPLDCLIGSISYSFQLYFDFSGYCDMAMGLARMLNINLPLNFNSPYKSKNIIDFWRRWHITLTKFLTEFVFTGTNLKLSRSLLFHKSKFFTSNTALYISIIFTFALSGIWHGAGWNFLIWGIFHGGLIILNYIWINFKKKLKIVKLDNSGIYANFSRIFTFFLVTLSFIFFRAENTSSALNLITSIYINISDIFIFSSSLLEKYTSINIFLLIFLLAFVISNFFPNSQEFTFAIAPKMNLYKKDLQTYKFLGLITKNRMLLVSSLLLIFLLALTQLINVSEYIYFRF